MTPHDVAELLLQQFSTLVVSIQVGTAQVRAVLRDGSFIDIWFNDRGRYSYHWQKGEGAIYRFNNAPHHPDIMTHPHHLHDGAQNNLKSSPVQGVTESDVTMVMQFIDKRINGRN